MIFLRRLDKHLEEIPLIILLVIIFVVMMIQIIMRFFSNALPWAEEFTRYCFVYSGFLSIGYTIRRGSILKVDIISSMFPDKVKKVLNIVLMMVTGIFFAYMWFYSIELVEKIYTTGQVSAALGMPIYILYIAAFIGLLIGVFRCVQNIVLQIKGLLGSSDKNLETPKKVEGRKE